MRSANNTIKMSKHCHKCEYYRAAGEYSHCQYILITGKMRNCAVEDCNKYVPKDKQRKLARKTNWTPELDAQVDKWREEGVKWREIAVRTGFSLKAATGRYYKRHKKIAAKGNQ